MFPLAAFCGFIYSQEIMITNCLTWSMQSNHLTGGFIMPIFVDLETHIDIPNNKVEYQRGAILISLVAMTASQAEQPLLIAIK